MALWLKALAASPALPRSHPRVKMHFFFLLPLFNHCGLCNMTLRLLFQAESGRQKEAPPTGSRTHVFVVGLCVGVSAGLCVFSVAFLHRVKSSWAAQIPLQRADAAGTKGDVQRVTHQVQVTFWGCGNPPLSHVSSPFSKPSYQADVEEEMEASGGSDTRRQTQCERSMKQTSLLCDRGRILLAWWANIHPSTANPMSTDVHR